MKNYVFIYRNAELAGELAVGEIPAADVIEEIGLAAGEVGGITAADDGDGGGIRGITSDGVEGGVGDDGVLVGEVEELFYDEMVAGAGDGLVVGGVLALLGDQLRAKGGGNT